MQHIVEHKGGSQKPSQVSCNLRQISGGYQSAAIPADCGTSDALWTSFSHGSNVVHVFSTGTKCSHGRIYRVDAHGRDSNVFFQQTQAASCSQWPHVSAFASMSWAQARDLTAVPRSRHDEGESRVLGRIGGAARSRDIGSVHSGSQRRCYERASWSRKKCRRSQSLQDS